MVITGGSALGKDEIDRMMKDAEAHAEEDKQRRDEAEVRNQAESLVHQTEKFVKDNEEKVPADVKARVETAITEANDALKGNDTAAIKAAVEKLATESQALGTAIYADAAAAGEASAPQGAQDDGVVDAEVVDEPAADGKVDFDKDKKEGDAK